MKKIILTGDRPTGRLHIGHYVGSLYNRVKLQNSGEYENIYILMADGQALTDNHKNPKKIRENMVQVVLDYLSIGLDPNKVTFCIQSELPALAELTFYYMNLVTLNRLKRNPTIKNEMQTRQFNDESLLTGFLCYPISQAADITAFEATHVPVGEDQKPMIEQTREIVESFNRVYGETLVLPDIILPDDKNSNRLVGTDGNEKMSKSLNNAIFLSDDEKVLHDKVFSCFTDPDHKLITDKGKVEGNVVFTYLDVFCKDDDFSLYLPEYKNLDEMKEHYRNGGLGDVKCKKLLFEVLNANLKPMREKRKIWEQKLDEVYDIIEQGTMKAREVTNNTMNKVKKAMMIDYFDDKNKIINEWKGLFV